MKYNRLRLEFAVTIQLTLEVKVQLCGLARVAFKNFGSLDHPKIVKDDQFILDRELSIWPQHKRTYRSNSQILNRGSHKWPFTFQLPQCQLPCSFEAKSGTVRYWVKVSIFDYCNSVMKKGVKYFTIIGPNIDCKDEKFMAPMTGHARKSHFACRRTKLVLDVKLKRTAYFCNELINLTASVDNQSDRSMGLKIKLRQNVEYRSDRLNSYSKLVVYTVCEHRGPIFGPGCHGFYDSMQDQPIRIQVVPPTMVGVCRLIQIYYILEVSLEDEDAIEEILSVDFPFTIGTMESRVKGRLIDYDFCSPHVEGGMFIDKKFRSDKSHRRMTNSDDYLFQISFTTPSSSSVGSLTNDLEDDDDDRGNNDHPGFMVILYRPVYVVLADRKVLLRKSSRQLQDVAGVIMKRRRSTLKMRFSKSYCNLRCLS